MNDSSLEMIKADSQGNFLCNFGGIDLMKGREALEVGYNAKFTGEASNEKEDTQEQTVLQKGLDWEPFKDCGMFKDSHPFLHPEKQTLIYQPKSVAEPIEEKSWYDEKNNRWMVKGQFLPHVPEAKHFVNLAKSFALNGSPRKLKFSIEGRIVDMEEKLIRKAQVLNVVITEAPVNTGTYLDILAKSLSMYKAITSSGAVAMKQESLEGSATLQVPPGHVFIDDNTKNKLVDGLLKKYKKMSRDRAKKLVENFVKKNTIAIAGGRNV